MASVGRNEPCPCGSGQKFKRCCLGEPSPTARRFVSAQAALDHFARGFVPDYVGFRSWLADVDAREREARRADAIASAQPGTTSLTREALLLFMRYQQAMQLGRLTSADFPKWKLLLNAFTDSERGQQLVSALTLPKADRRLHELTPAELRLQLFAAVESGNETMAMKLLGAIQSRPSDHDRGEADYLAAACHLKACQLDDAIEAAQHVPDGVIDSPRARHVELIAHALSGHVDDVVEIVNATRGRGLTPAMVYRAALLVCANADLEPDTFERLANVLPDEGSLHGYDPRHDSEQKDLVIDLLNVASSFLLRLKQAHAALAAADSSAGDFEATLERALESDPALQRHVFALTSVGLLDGLLDELNHAKTGWEILLHVANLVGSPDSAFYLTTSATMAALGEHEVLCESVTPLLEEIDTLPTEFATSMLLTVLPSQLLVRPDEAVATIERLRALNVEHAEYVASAKVQRIAARLGPVARATYESSVADLEHATALDLRWKDAGLISLGLFRVIELEVNRRLVVPALRSIGDADFTNAKASLDDRARDWWAELLKSIDAIRKNVTQGLSLGPLERLLGKTRRLGDASDLQLRAVLRHAFQVRLSDDGKTALGEGRLAKLVDGRARERFRNPGAHARFVSLAAARDCREYVEDAITRLDTYLRSAA